MINGTKQVNHDQVMTRSRAKRAKAIESNDFSDSSSFSSLGGSPTFSWPDTSSFDEFLLEPSSSEEGLGHDALDKYPYTSLTDGWDFDWISRFVPDQQTDLWSVSFSDLPLELLGDTTKFLHTEIAIDFGNTDIPFEISAEMPIDPDQFFADNMNNIDSAPLVSFVDDGSKKDEDKAQVSETQEPVQLAKTSEPITPAFKAASQGNTSFPILSERKSKLAAIENMKRKRPF